MVLVGTLNYPFAALLLTRIMQRFDVTLRRKRISRGRIRISPDRGRAPSLSPNVHNSGRFCASLANASPTIFARLCRSRPTSSALSRNAHTASIRCQAADRSGLFDAAKPRYCAPPREIGVRTRIAWFVSAMIAGPKLLQWSKERTRLVSMRP